MGVLEGEAPADSLSQAQRIRELGQEGTLTVAKAREILAEIKKVIDDLQEDGETADENPTDISSEEALVDTADPTGSTDENDQDQPVEADEYTEVPAADDANIEGGEDDGAVDVISEDFPFSGVPGRRGRSTAGFGHFSIYVQHNTIYMRSPFCYSQRR